MVLARTQTLLEECCYDFTKKYMPGLLGQKKWDCVEAIELNKWTLEITNRHAKLLALITQCTDRKITQTLRAVDKLRHSAVHRLHISTNELLQMIRTAVRFADILTDMVRAAQFESVYQEVECKVQFLELNKKYLEIKLQSELDGLEFQHGDLAKRQQRIVFTLEAEYMDMALFVASGLELGLHDILHRKSSQLAANEYEINHDNAQCQEESLGGWHLSRSLARAINGSRLCPHSNGTYGQDWDSGNFCI